MPAATASSTAYWMRGLSTIGIISLGEALVAGRKRVPRPATGKTALVILCMDSLCAEHLEEPFLVQHRDAEFPGLVELRSGFLAGHHEIGLLRHRSRHLPAGGFDPLLRLLARQRR